MDLRGGTVLAALLCLLAAPAAAQETYRLDYVRKPGAEVCPSEAAFRAAVSQEVGRNPFLPDASNLLTVVFSRFEKKIRVQIVAKPASGSEQGAPEHEKPAWDCAGLLRHAAFSAGMLIDPLEPQEPEQSAALPPPAPAAPPPPPAPPPQSPPPLSPRSPLAVAARLPRAAPPTRLQFSLGGGAAFGSTPDLSPSVIGGIGLRQDEISLSAELRYDHRSDRLESPYQIHGTQHFGIVAPCWHVHVRAWLEFDRCGLLSVGWTQANIQHKNEVLKFKLEEDTFTVGVGVRAGLSFTFGTSLAVFSRLDVLFVPAPPVVEDEGREIWTYPYASAAVQVGLVYAFDVTHPTAKPPPAPLF